MQDEEFDNWLRTAAHSYNEPPPPDVERMWTEIEQQHFNVKNPVIAVTPLRASRWHTGWMGVAAALILGVALGRVSLSPAPLTPASNAPPATPQAIAGSSVLQPVLNSPEANKYMGATIALLASLQTDARSASGDKQLVSGAADLLNTTRFLLDSPNTSTDVRRLLEDLELVLAQIVQLSNQGSADDVELIHQAMEQRDVMPRLRTAVANNYSSE